MSSALDLDSVTEQLGQSTITLTGVSIEAQSKKLDTEEDAKELVESIKNCSELHYLNLAGNTLGVDAAKAVGKALEGHKEFKRAIWKDLFTGRLKSEIPQALQFLGAGLVLAGARLTELDLSDNAFGPIGVEGLAVLLRSPACFALQELRLNNNGLGIGGGKLLAKALLDCHSNSSAKGQPLALKVFVAGRNRLENDGAKALARVFKTLGSLQVIAMPQNGIYHVGISALADALTKCTQLSELNLNDNTVTWRGAEALAKTLPSLKLLKSLNLGDCLLKTKGAITISSALAQGQPQLEELILCFNEIKAKGAEAIAKAMEGKSNLKQLSLDGNMFGDAGRTVLRSQLNDLGLLETLASLSEDEDDSDGSDGEGEESEQEEEEEGSESERQDSSAANTPVKITLNTSIIKKNEPSTPDPSIPVYTIVESPEKVDQGPVSIPEFLENPTPDRLMAMGEDRTQILLSAIKEFPKDDMLIKGIPLLMAVSNAAATRREPIRTAALEAGVAMYRELFSWAETTDSLSLLNNSILVHMALIKNEEKHTIVDITWNLEGCMLVLEQVCQQNLLPPTTKDTLQIFLGRPNMKVDSFPEMKRKLMVALFKF